jgi:hypothetical protein
MTPRVEIYERAHCGGIGSPFPERVELFRELRLDTLEEVAVNTQSEGGVAVAHALGHGQGVGPQVETGMACLRS